MSDEKDIYQNLSAIRIELSEASIAVAKSLQTFANSPEMQRIVEVSNKAAQAIPEALTRFAELAAPYTDIARSFTADIVPYLPKIAKATERLSVIYRLGEAEYVIWHRLPDVLYEKAAETKTEDGLLELLLDWLADTQFKEIYETLNLLKSTEELEDNPVFEQALNAYLSCDYDIAALGLTAMIDRLLSLYSGMLTSTSIKNRARTLCEKVSIDGEGALDDMEIEDFVLLCTYTSAIEKFGADSRFNESEPVLNRHWIAHGRMNRRTEQIDCIRLINILYGTILISRMAQITDD